MAPPVTVERQASKNPAVEKKMYRFRIHAGGHFHPMPILDEETGKPRLDNDGKPIMQDVIFGPGRAAGDIVVTTARLDKVHNVNGFKKFELLDQNDNPLVSQLQEAEQARQSADDRLRRMLNRFTGGELLDFARSEGVDLKTETDETKIRNLILASYGLQPIDPKEQARQMRRSE